MIDRIMEEEEFEWAEMKTKIMNCYRALYRENPGNTSASSGAGKAKSLKPKGAWVSPFVHQKNCRENKKKN